MGIDITLHGKIIESVFDLLGASENDITYSLGWCLANSETLRSALSLKLFPQKKTIKFDKVSLQEHKHGLGITDIELYSPDFHVIIEAKRGWDLPSADQLLQYAKRFEKDVKYKKMVTMSECSDEYYQLHPYPEILGIPVQHMSWNKVCSLAKTTNASHAEKRLLKQFRTYLERIVKMQNQQSNMVYVVSVAEGMPEWSSIPWQDYITKRRIYFHPVGNKWPKEPPNYIAFRYNGQLQSIHHIESWQIATNNNIHQVVPEIVGGNDWNHFVYTLGNPIRPSHTVKSGRIWHNRLWVMLDLLLSCKTISEAHELTKRRLPED